MISPLRLTKLIAALGVLFLAAFSAASPTAPTSSTLRASTAPALDLCSGYSVANARC